MQSAFFSTWKLGTNLYTPPAFMPNPGNKKRPQTSYYFAGVQTLGEDKNTEEEGVPVLKWSAIAPLEVLTLPAVGVEVIWPDDDEDNNFFEVDRTTHTETITDEDNPDISIDVDVVDTLAVKNKKKKLFTYDYTGGGGV